MPTDSAGASHGSRPGVARRSPGSHRPHWRLPCLLPTRRTCSAASAARARPANSRPRGPSPLALPDTPPCCVAVADLGVRFVALAKVANGRAFARVADAPGLRLVYSSPSLDLFSVRPTAEQTREDRRVRSVDLVDYRVLLGRPGVVALPVPYSQGGTLDGHSAVRLADGQAGILAPAGGGVVHYGPSSGVLAGEIGSLAAALAVAGVAFFERRRRALGRSDPDLWPLAAHSRTRALAPSRIKLRRRAKAPTLAESPRKCCIHRW